MRAPTLIAAAALFLSACQGSPPAAAPAPSAAPTVEAAPVSDTPVSVARRLALSKPGGTSLVDKEIEHLQTAAEKSASVADPWVLLGRAWVRKAREASDPGFYLNAKASADVALDIAPGDRAATNLVGLVLLNDHKFDDASDLAAQLLLASPDDLMALGTQADALVELGRYEEARKLVQRMGDLKPNLPSYIRSSYLHWLRGDVATAREAARLAVDAGRDPRDPEPRCWALVQAAMIFWHEGDGPGADAGFQAALKDCSDYPPALVGRGRVAIGAGEYARAAEHLSLAYKQSPLVETAWLLGDAREGAGDAKGAAEAWADVVKHGRKVDGRTLALFYATKDREHEEAIRLAEAERKVRDDLYTEDTYAWALYRAGRMAEARAASDKAIALGTRDARLLYHAGAIRIAAGDKAGGEKLVKDALRYNPRFDRSGAAEASMLVGEKRSGG